MTPGNTLFYGDNLDILRHHIASELVDLIYLDPPFNSKRDYNVLFKEKSGEASPAQIEAFTDTWAWDLSAERTYANLINDAPVNVAQMIAALKGFIGANDMMAYLVMMTARLIELHRVLKPTGSLYLHCDPTASHYLKIILDTVFGSANFRSEIVWKRTSAHSSSLRFGPVHDIILFYSKSQTYLWNQQFEPLDDAYVSSHYSAHGPDNRAFTLSDLTGAGTRKGSSGQPWRGFDPNVKGRHWVATIDNLEQWDREGKINWPANGGWPRFRRYLDERKGNQLQDVWTDISPINAKATERMGYPTQKPLELLERIISASSNPGDVVLDPFCGCGTAVVAAQKLGRTWIGIDVTHLAIALMKYRLTESFPGIQFTVRGEPADAGGARMLAEADRYQFQWWALSLVRAKPVEGKEKKGADRGIDGLITFVDDHTGKLKRCLVQVKSGHVSSATIRDLAGTVEREKAELGVLITLDEPTGPMRKEAAEAGFYHSDAWKRDYPKIQIATIAALLGGVEPAIPHGVMTFGRGPRIAPEPPERQAGFTLPMEPRLPLEP